MMMMASNAPYPIDFVILWVDGNDPAWRAERNHYAPKKDNDDQECRYRDWDLMRYWFRGVERFAPWVRNIHFVTWGHLPPWLNTLDPRLHIVRHEDFIPKENLPLFNSNAIEVFIHRIPGLAEHFVLFNDDFFCIDHLKPEHFFCDGKPCQMLACQPVIANPKNPVMSHIYINNSLVLSRHFDKRACMKKHPGLFWHPSYPLQYLVYNTVELCFPQITGFYTAHTAGPFLKSTFEEVWALENEALSETGTHRFRDEHDLSQYLFCEWQKLSGNIMPHNTHKIFSYAEIGKENEGLLKMITWQKKPILCINDSSTQIDFDAVQKQLSDAFRTILPEKCSFEK